VKTVVPGCQLLCALDPHMTLQEAALNFLSLHSCSAFLTMSNRCKQCMAVGLAAGSAESISVTMSLMASTCCRFDDANGDMEMLLRLRDDDDDVDEFDDNDLDDGEAMEEEDVPLERLRGGMHEAEAEAAGEDSTFSMSACVGVLRSSKARQMTPALYMLDGDTPLDPSGAR